MRWRDARIGVNTRSSTGYTLPTPLTRARPCRLPDVELAPSFGPAAGTVYGALKVHNVSTTACSLHGRPSLALLDVRGAVWQSSSPQSAALRDRAATVVLVPNSWAVASGWMIGSSCGGFGVTTTLRVALPGGAATRDVPFTVGWPGLRGCDPQQSARPKPHLAALDTPNFTALPTVDDNGYFALLGNLDAALRVPAAVHPGQTLRYSVVFSSNDDNGGGIADAVCPLYRQSIDGSRAAVTTYQLDCSRGANLRRGEGIEYQMQLRVAADKPPGPATLRWQFVEPALPAVSTAVTVVR